VTGGPAGVITVGSWGVTAGTEKEEKHKK